MNGLNAEGSKPDGPGFNARSKSRRLHSRSLQRLPYHGNYRSGAMPKERANVDGVWRTLLSVSHLGSEIVQAADSLGNSRSVSDRRIHALVERAAETGESSILPGVSRSGIIRAFVFPCLNHGEMIGAWCAANVKAKIPVFLAARFSNPCSNPGPGIHRHVRAKYEDRLAVGWSFRRCGRHRLIGR
jgi:hypothetical protein